MRALWKDKVIAESDDTVLVEGNHYFPAKSLNQANVVASNHTTSCAGKGRANSYSLLVDGDMNRDAVKERVGFWKGVQVV